jgi:TM2 domain-containing membrane protein YozV
MGRRSWGALYVCTFGLLGWGVLVDLVTLRGLRERRSRAGRAAPPLIAPREDEWLRGRDMYALWVLGFLGAHHFYAGRKFHGVAYLLTLGLFGVGWAVDLLRMPFLVTRRDDDISLGEAYLYLIPCGLFGLHHVYLGSPWRAAWCLVTLNYLGVGYLLDLVRLPVLVEAAMQRQQLRLESGLAAPLNAI